MLSIIKYNTYYDDKIKIYTCITNDFIKELIDTREQLIKKEFAKYMIVCYNNKEYDIFSKENCEKLIQMIKLKGDIK